MSDTRSGTFSCCGLFKVQTRGNSAPSEKYKVRTDDNLSHDKHDDVSHDKHDDVNTGDAFITHNKDDDDKEIVPLEDKVGISSAFETLNSEFEKHIEDFTSKFQAVVGDGKELDAWQLREILNQLFTDVAPDGFCLDVCRGMVALCDHNLSGQMSYSETTVLFCQLQKWKGTFRSFDTDEKGSIPAEKLPEILKELGYEADSKTIQTMKVRYGNKEGRITFVDFVSCLLKFTSFQEIYKDKQNNNDPAFEADEFMQLTMYC